MNFLHLDNFSLFYKVATVPKCVVPMLYANALPNSLFAFYYLTLAELQFCVIEAASYYVVMMLLYSSTCNGNEVFVNKTNPNNKFSSASTFKKQKSCHS